MQVTFQTQSTYLPNYLEYKLAAIWVRFYETSLGWNPPSTFWYLLV